MKFERGTSNGQYLYSTYWSRSNKKCKRPRHVAKVPKIISAISTMGANVGAKLKINYGLEH